MVEPRLLYLDTLHPKHTAESLSTHVHFIHGDWCSESEHFCLGLTISETGKSLNFNLDPEFGPGERTFQVRGFATQGRGPEFKPRCPHEELGMARVTCNHNAVRNRNQHSSRFSDRTWFNRIRQRVDRGGQPLSSSSFCTCVHTCMHTP